MGCRIVCLAFLALMKIKLGQKSAQRVVQDNTKIRRADLLVTNAPPARHRPNKEVSNATEPHAKQAHSSTTSILENVQRVHKVGHRKSWMPRYARVALLAPPRWPMPVEVRCALGAILVCTATPQNPVNVPPANPVSFKTSRAKLRVPSAQSARRPTAKQRRVKTHLGALAKLAKNTCTT
jgi:hypothetical protein